METPENNFGNNPKKKSFREEILDRVQDFADEKFAEVVNKTKEWVAEKKEQRADKRESRKGKIIFQKARKSPELWSEAMKIAELKNPTPSGVPGWLAEKFELARKKEAEDYLEHAVYGTTVREDREARKLSRDKRITEHKKSLWDLQQEAARDRGFNLNEVKSEADVETQRAIFAEAKSRYESKENLITKKEKLEQKQDRAKELETKREEAIKHNRKEIQKLESKQNRSEDEEQILRTKIERNRLWGEYKNRPSLTELEITDKQELGRLNLSKEEGKESAAFQEIRKRLWQMGLEVAQGRESQEYVARDQDELILDSERRGAEKWKSYIDGWIAERDWRGDIRVPYLPRNWTVWWGKAEVAAFDFLTGGWVKRLGETGLKESRHKAIDSAPTSAIKEYETKLNPKPAGSFDKYDQRLIMLGVAQIPPYQIVIDIYRHAVVNPKKQEAALKIEQRHVIKRSVEEIGELLSKNPDAKNALWQEIFGLLKAHTDIYLRDSGLSLSEEEIKDRARVLFNKALGGLKRVYGARKKESAATPKTEEPEEELTLKTIFPGEKSFSEMSFDELLFCQRHLQDKLDTLSQLKRTSKDPVEINQASQSIAFVKDDIKKLSRYIKKKHSAA